MKYNIDDQDTLNYRYDKNGNLVFDAAEEIDTIRWTVSGKIEAVIRATASTKPSLYFYYDALGNRSIKQVIPASGTQTFEFYKRDATGNILATYKMADSSGTKILKLEQREIYGSSRLGVVTQEVRIAENASWPSVLPTYDTANAPFVLWNTDSTYQDSVFINPFDSVGYKIKVNKYLGFRNYELTNHLGNVLAVISDRKYGEDADTDGQLELFNPNVLSETDYYAFGSEVKERSVSGGYKFGFNGQMKDDEIYGVGNANTAMFWEYDTRLGRRWNLDPEPRFGISEYSAMGLNPINLIDPNGNYFFGLIGSSKQQRDAAREFAKNNPNSKINNITSKNISVSYDKLVLNSPIPHHDAKMASFGLDYHIETTETFFNNDGSERVEKSEIKEYNPSTMMQWSESENFLAKASYSTADAVFVTTQNLLTKHLFGRSNAYHLNGQESTPSENMDAFVDVGSKLIPSPGKVTIIKKLNCAQFSKVFKGNLSKMNAQFRGYMNKGVNFVIDNLNSTASKPIRPIKKVAKKVKEESFSEE
ncbi:MAG: hypothetical protein K1X82_01605 [Bacteroidia bacterium]|nr:hypothetical protein [Bacteroidia bacterium]